MSTVASIENLRACSFRIDEKFRWIVLMHERQQENPEVGSFRMSRRYFRITETKE